jgi:hypothetical protein
MMYGVELARDIYNIATHSLNTQKIESFYYVFWLERSSIFNAKF